LKNSENSVSKCWKRVGPRVERATGKGLKGIHMPPRKSQPETKEQRVRKGGACVVEGKPKSGG